MRTSGSHSATNRGCHRKFVGIWAPGNAVYDGRRTWHELDDSVSPIGSNNMKLGTRTLPEPVAESTNKSSQISLVGVGGWLLQKCKEIPADWQWSQDRCR